ncbi:MAG: preprotein translocase subunit SecA, partial [Candidatus Bipolaricaulota bacterium]
MAIDTIRHAVERMLGQTNAQQLKKYEKELRAVNAWIDDVAALSDDALRAKAAEFKQQLEDGVSKSSLRAEVYAVVREVAARTIGLRPFDVQILGGFALGDRKIAEMATGEGKTLVATLPATLNALCG